MIKPYEHGARPRKAECTQRLWWLGNCINGTNVLGFLNAVTLEHVDDLKTWHLPMIEFYMVLNASHD